MLGILSPLVRYEREVEVVRLILSSATLLESAFSSPPCEELPLFPKESIRLGRERKKLDLFPAPFPAKPFCRRGGTFSKVQGIFPPGLQAPYEGSPRERPL